MRPNGQETVAAYEPIWDSLDAARYLRVHPRTITRMAKRGEIPAIHLGRLWRFRKADLDAWLEARAGGFPLDVPCPRS
jgi:excisionase family DNA binding protein